MLETGYSYLRSVCAHQVDRLGLVLLPLGCVLVNHHADGDWVCEHPRGKSFQAGQHLKSNFVKLFRLVLTSSSPG